MSDNAIVVGAGVGGLACAALLAHGGYKVTVFEKNLFIGGACSSYQKKATLSTAASTCSHPVLTARSVSF